MKLKIGILGFNPKGEFVDGEYDYFDVVSYNNKAWVVSDTNGTVTGEIPGSSSKWKLLVSLAEQTYDSDSILYTDSDGLIKEIPKSVGILKCDSNGDLSFVPEAPSQASVMLDGRYKKFGREIQSYNSSAINMNGRVCMLGVYEAFLGGQASYPFVLEIENPQEMTGEVEMCTTNGQSLAMITSTNELWVMGRNTDGELGLGHNVETPFWKKVEGSYTDIVFTSSLLYVTTLAVNTDGELLTAGSNNYASLGRVIDITNPANKLCVSLSLPGEKVILGSKFPENRYSAYIVMTDASVDNMFAWGRNAYGESGRGSTGQINTPIRITTGKKIVDVIHLTETSSYATISVITEDGFDMTSGYNNGATGVNSSTAVYTFEVRNPYSGYVAIAGTDGQYPVRAAARADNKIDVWGYNNSGALGMTTASKLAQTLPLEVDDKIKQIIIAGTYARAVLLVLTVKGTLYVAGTNAYGAGAEGTNIKVSIFEKVETIRDIVEIKTCSWTSLISVQAILSDGKMKAWGYGSRYGVPIGKAVTTDLPTSVK